MPVTAQSSSNHAIYQRDQYKKGGFGRIYWDYRDKVALSFLDDNDRRIVDLGCGEGITLGKIAAAYPDSEVFGIDTLDENIDICKKHNLSVQKGEVNRIVLPDNHLDAVVFMEVIEHLEEPKLIVNEIYRVLKPGGKLIVVYPNDAVFMFARIVTLRFKEATYDPGHLKQWTPKELKKFLEEIGFTISCSKCLPFLCWSLSLHGLTCARKKPFNRTKF